MRETSQLTEEETEYFSIRHNAKTAVYDEIMRDYEQSIFQVVESILGTISIKEDEFNFIFESFFPIFEIYEIPPGFNEFSGIKNSLNNL